MRKNGFTILEVLLVIAIFSIIVVMFLPVGVDFYKIQLINRTNDQILWLLKSARNNAITQQNNSDFGYYYNDNMVVLFEGSSYDSREQDKDFTYSVPSDISIIGPSEIVFEKYTGNPDQTGTISVLYYQHSRDININSEGLITN